MLVESKEFKNNRFLTVDESLYINSKFLTFYRKVSINEGALDKSLIFSGRGSITRDNCGHHFGFYSCSKGHTIKHKNTYCYSLSCPICFHKAIKRNSYRVLNHIIKIYKEYKRLGHKIHFRHYSFNTLWDIKNSNQFDYYRRKLVSILNQYDFHGMLVFHKYRKSKVSKQDYQKGIRPTLYYSPHFHVIGYGFLPNYSEFESLYGFTYTNITEKHYFLDSEKYPKFLNKKSIYLCVRYLLSHASFKSNQKAHSYFWFGNMSPQRTYRILEKKISDPVLCKVCNEKLFKIDNPSFIKMDLDNCICEYQIEYPYKLDKKYFLTKKKYIYQVRFKKKYKIKDIRKFKGF